MKEICKIKVKSYEIKREMFNVRNTLVGVGIIPEYFSVMKREIDTPNTIYKFYETDDDTRSWEFNLKEAM